MITGLSLCNFKSHQATVLGLGALTVLTGLNSSGKSSIIQSLLLLRQSYQKGRLSKGLDLNEPLVDIGRGSDALFRNASDNEIISIVLEVASGRYSFDFDVSGKYDSSFIPLLKKEYVGKVALEDLPLFTSDFQYLSAGRVGGMEFYPVDSYAVEEERQISRNYGQGDLVAHFLEYYGHHRDFEVSSENLLHPSESSRKLLAQVVAWEQEISPDLTINTKRVGDKIAITYGYKSHRSHIASLSDIKSQNVGFGISYSLAIVVALLSARAGSLLLIENPEAHLHPQGQSKLSELICLAAQSGIQVVVETHSDHVINGILVSGKQYEQGGRGIDRQAVRLYYLGEKNENHSSVCQAIGIEEGGKISVQPRGFFDQLQEDLSKLMGF